VIQANSDRGRSAGAGYGPAKDKLIKISLITASCTPIVTFYMFIKGG